MILTIDENGVEEPLLDFFWCDCCEATLPRNQWDSTYGCCHDCAFCASLYHFPCCHGDCE